MISVYSNLNLDITTSHVTNLVYDTNVFDENIYE